MLLLLNLTQNCRRCLYSKGKQTQSIFFLESRLFLERVQLQQKAPNAYILTLELSGSHFHQSLQKISRLPVGGTVLQLLVCLSWTVPRLERTARKDRSCRRIVRSFQRWAILKRPRPPHQKKPQCLACGQASKRNGSFSTIR